MTATAGGLTPRMRDALDAIEDLTIDGVPPTYRELQGVLHVGATDIVRLLARLKERGFIDYKPHTARTLRILPQSLSPALLGGLSDEALRGGAAMIAGLLAHREGGNATETAAMFRRIADSLPGQARGRAA